MRSNVLINIVIIVLMIKYFIFIYSLSNSNNAGVIGKTKIVEPLPFMLDKSTIVEKNSDAVITIIKQKIERINRRQKIYNEEIFGSWLQNDAITIIIQVHDRITYLRHLIKSLSEVDGISSVLLIFSHDHYNEVMNVLVRNIHFCKVMQIFYPYSLQVNPTTFPGDDKSECPSKKFHVTKQNDYCFGSYDTYGNLREAKYCQMKHHWWWGMVRIFDELKITRNYTGLVVYLEEDNYVLKDILYMLKFMFNTSVHFYPTVNVFSLRTPWYNNNYMNYHNEISIDKFVMQGVAINRTTWNNIKECSEFFCNYDDYNWDWSLYNVASKCTPLVAMSCKLPRIYHIGYCGMHTYGDNCKPWLLVKRIKEFFEYIQEDLYPKNLRLIKDNPQVVRDETIPFGGWGDIRDQNMCLSMYKHVA